MIKFITHFYDLKIKFFYIFLSFIFSFLSSIYNISEIIYLLMMPIIPLIEKNNAKIIFTNIFEVFNTYAIIAVYCIILFNTPTILYLLLTFIKSGLFKHEKKNLFTCYKVFNINLLISSLFSFFIVLPSIMNFLLSLTLIVDKKYIALDMQIKLFDYVDLVCYFLYAYNFLIFQSPSIFLIYIFLKKPKGSFFYTKRRLSIIFFFFVGCMFSSPDIYCLLLITIPLILVFEISTLLCLIRNKYDLYT